MRTIYPNINGTATFSQGEYDTPSHMNQRALDLMYNLYAPFDMEKVGDSRYKGGHQQYFESTSKLQLPNGQTDYISMVVEHSADNPKIGTIFKKGKLVLKMGNVGTDATHLHIVVGQGKVNKSLIGKYHNANTSGFEEPRAINIKSAKDLFYKPAKLVWNYESKPVAFKTMPKPDTRNNFTVWGLTNQFGQPIYFYAEWLDYKDGSVDRNQLDGDGEREVFYYPEGYKPLVLQERVFLYKDKNLTQKMLDSNGNHIGIYPTYKDKKGNIQNRIFIAKYYGKIKK